ncbi:PP2C family protein-serine/threonine phosphatase [Idiomarina abyssalis]|uniref:PP2C family protein-serine/threonine phosphatase n=1 Tax=Idiomarina abyssalis TaxID=86102 RepID=UPI00241CEB02|nr:fused response regulator/phosphatase [Idiomarina abyssalis]|tara:strand:- start:7270 stop:8940 length:1671 start_codon:yes stop_codon:yes gene_type:complete
MKVLIVDDQPANQVMLSGLIKRFGHQVRCASNGIEAIDVFSGLEPDVVLLDVMMPIMDGFETAPCLKALSGDVHLPILFITALDDQETLLKCLEAGGDDFISVPFEPVVLQAKLNAHARVRELSHSLKGKNEALAYHSNRMEREQNVVSHMLANALQENETQYPFLKTYLAPASEFNGDLVLTKAGPLGNFYLFVGDFTGHGLAPATGALPVSQTFFDLADKGLSIANMVEEFNRKLVKLLPDDMFCAAFVAELSANGERLTYWNGGIPDALLINEAGQVENRLVPEHMALGILPPEEFSSQVSHCFIGKGIRLITYTDGVVEMTNQDDQRLSEDGFEELLRRYACKRDFDGLVTALQKFQQGQEQFDDVSLVCLDCGPTNLPVIRPDTNVTHLPFRLVVYLKEDEIRGRDPIIKLVDSLSHLEGIRAHKTTLYLLLAEAFNNTLEHSFLQLDSEIKQTGQGFDEYYRAREERLAELEGVEIEIDIEYRPKSSLLSFSLSSNSENGFNEPVNDTEEDESLAFGRGLQLIRNFSSHVEWRDNGRCLYIEYDLSLPSA